MLNRNHIQVLHGQRNKQSQGAQLIFFRRWGKCQDQPLLQLLFQAMSHLETLRPGLGLEVDRGLQNLGRPQWGESLHPVPDKQRRFRKFTRSCQVCSLLVLMCNMIHPIFHDLCRYRLRPPTAISSAAIKNDKGP